MLPGRSRDEEELVNWPSEWSGDPRRLQSIDRGARLSGGEGATVLDPLKESLVLGASTAGVGQGLVVRARPGGQSNFQLCKGHCRALAPPSALGIGRGGS